MIIIRIEIFCFDHCNKTCIWKLPFLSTFFSPWSKMILTPPVATFIFIFSLHLHYPSHCSKNLGRIFCTPPTKSHLAKASSCSKLLFLHFTLLLECPSPPPLSLPSYNKRCEMTLKNETFFYKFATLLQQNMWNNRFQTEITHIPRYNCLVYDDLWNMELFYLNQFRWKSSSLEVLP